MSEKRSSDFSKVDLELLENCGAEHLLNHAFLAPFFSREYIDEIRNEKGEELKDSLEYILSTVLNNTEQNIENIGGITRYKKALALLKKSGNEVFFSPDLLTYGDVETMMDLIALNCGATLIDVFGKNNLESLHTIIGKVLNYPAKTGLVSENLLSKLDSHEISYSDAIRITGLSRSSLDKKVRAFRSAK